jgi:predicted extracellular nuclease
MVVFCGVQNISAQPAEGGKAGSTAVTSNVVISEIYSGGSLPATYNRSYIELFNRGTSTVDLSGWTIQSTFPTGSTWFRSHLTSTLLGPGQHYLIWGPLAGHPNGPTPPAPDNLGNFGVSSTGGKLALVNNTEELTGSCPASANIVDFLGYGPADCFETAAAPSFNNVTAEPRAGDGCTDGNNNSTDFVVAAPAPQNSISAPAPCTGPLAIHHIQGSTGKSAFLGSTLTLNGIVTARTSDGFFIQLPDGEADADPNTSEGIFVSAAGAPPALATLGNRISVTGEIFEYQSYSDPPRVPTDTQIIMTGGSSVISTGNALPAPVVLTAADTDGAILENLERYEGMRVSVGSLTVAAPTGGTVNETTATATTDGDFFGVIAGLPRPFREPGIPITLGVLQNDWPQLIPRFDINPERLRVDSDGQTGIPPIEVISGAVITNMTGVVSQVRMGYAILPDSAPVVSGNTPAQSIDPPGENTLSLASLDLQRFYDDTVDHPGSPEIVLTPAAFSGRLKKASMAIRTIMRYPDVIGVQEVENLATLEAIATRVNSDSAAAGDPDPGYIAYLTEGNDSEGLDVGVLVKSARVDPVEVAQFGADATFINPNTGTAEILFERPPLLLRATVPDSVSNSFPFTVIVNHLTGMDEFLGGFPPFRHRAQRRAQAEYMAGFLQSRQGAAPAERIIALGNFQAYQFNDGVVDVMGTLRGNPTPSTHVLLASTDLVDPDLLDIVDLLAAGQRYTHIFRGSAEMLDHILYTGNVAYRAPQAEVARIGADYPETYRNDDTRPERVTDHDAPVLRISTIPAAPVSVGGQVLTRTAQAISGATVVLRDQTGVKRTVIVNPFGYYRFDNVRVEESYTISASAKRYRFTPRVITVFGDLLDVNFITN